jgi:hypothetical protein
MENIEKSESFERVFQFACETSQSVFLTGKAGTGKTTLLKYIRENCHKQIAVVAPTGVAAINAGGATIHSFFQLPFTPFIPPQTRHISSPESRNLISHTRFNKTRLAILRQLELLIIDEISMVRCDILDAIDCLLRSVRQKFHLPFGGVQVIMVGDMYQLPPVIKDEEWSLLHEKYQSPFFFDSHIVKELNPVYIELEKIFRQEQPVFIELLNKVRNNNIDEETVALLNSRYNIVCDASAIVLTTHNYMADKINTDELEKLPAKEYIYNAEIEGIFPEKSYPAEPVLRLKTGARVMFTRNDSAKRFFNGKCGILKSLNSESVTVQCEGDENAITVSAETWDNINYTLDKSNGKVTGEKTGSFSQLPLRLAWAITIHKSQGLTFDKVIIDAGKAFTAGQVYVALSRCRSLDGIYLKSVISRYSLSNDQKIVSFSGTKTPDENVNLKLTEGKRNYIRDIISGIFSVKDLKADLHQLEKDLEIKKQQFLSYDAEWIGQMMEKIHELDSTSSKFEKELTSLMNPDKVLLDARISKGSAYFRERLEVVRNLILKCPLITESVLVSKEISPQLEEINSLIALKTHMLSACSNGFDLQEYIRHRELFIKPVQKIKIYAVDNKQDNSKNKDKSNELLMALQDLRDEICREEGKPVYLVANKNTLVDICKYLPTDQQALMKIKGFGKAKAASIGPRFIEVVKEHIDLYNLEPVIMPEKIDKQHKVPSQKRIAGSSDAESFLLFKQGKTVEQIADIRNLAIGTIHSHLAKFIETGELLPGELVNEEYVKVITNAIHQNPEFKTLTELKEKCGEYISYADIRYVVAYQRFQKGIVMSAGGSA